MVFVLKKRGEKIELLRKESGQSYGLFDNRDLALERLSRIKPRNRKPSMKALKAIKYRAVHGSTQKEALVKSGYSEATAKRPSKVFEAPTTKRAVIISLEKQGLTDDFFSKVHDDLAHACKMQELIVPHRTSS